MTYYAQLPSDPRHRAVAQGNLAETVRLDLMAPSRRRVPTLRQYRQHHDSAARRVHLAEVTGVPGK